MLRMFNLIFARPALRAIGYVFAALSAVGGTILTSDALTGVSERKELNVIEGQVLSADRVIRRNPPIRLYAKHKEQATYSIRIVVGHGERKQLLLIPEPKLQHQDISDLRGASVTALIEGVAEVWELKTPTRTFFTYEETRSTQNAGKRMATMFGPLLLAIGMAGLLLLWRARRSYLASN
jgi:hypothetical protein